MSGAFRRIRLVLLLLFFFDGRGRSIWLRSGWQFLRKRESLPDSECKKQEEETRQRGPMQTGGPQTFTVPLSCILQSYYKRVQFV